jgi:hypothetical protein
LLALKPSKDEKHAAPGSGIATMSPAVGRVMVPIACAIIFQAPGNNDVYLIPTPPLCCVLLEELAASRIQIQHLRKQNQETLCRNRKTPAFGNNEPEQKLSAPRNDQSSRYPLPSTDNSVSLSVPLPLCEVLFYLSIVQAGTEASEV